MSGFFDKLNDISNKLDNISNIIDDTKDAIDRTIDDTKDVVYTANYGLKKTQESGKNISDVIQGEVSGENAKNKEKIIEYEKRENLSVLRTVIFCVLVILATILICVFV